MTIRTADQAVALALTTTRWTENECLNFVWEMYAIGATHSQLPPLSVVSYASQGWEYSQHKHPGDRNPPKGAICYYTAAKGGATAGDGHVCISEGGGKIRTTLDDARGGEVETQPLSFPETAWGRTYLGWTSDILGWPISFDSATASLDATQITTTPTEKEDNMKIIAVTGGTIALVGEFYGEEFTAETFSVTTNEAIYGPGVTGLTPDEVTTAVNEANARYAKLIADVAAAVLAKIPAAVVTAAPTALALTAAEIQAIATAVNTDAAKRLAA